MPQTGTCPDCGRPITLQPSGWWVHDGMPNGCWRLSMDGPSEDADPEVCPECEQDWTTYNRICEDDLEAEPPCFCDIDPSN